MQVLHLQSVLQSVKDFQLLHGNQLYLDALMWMQMMNTTVMKNYNWKSIRVIFQWAENKMVQQMNGSASVETDQCYGSKAFNNIKGKQRLRPIHSDSTSLSSHFTRGQRDSPGDLFTVPNVV